MSKNELRDSFNAWVTRNTAPRVLPPRRRRLGALCMAAAIMFILVAPFAAIGAITWGILMNGVYAFFCVFGEAAVNVALVITMILAGWVAGLISGALVMSVLQENEADIYVEQPDPRLR